MEFTADTLVSGKMMITILSGDASGKTMKILRAYTGKIPNLSTAGFPIVRRIRLSIG